MESSLHIYIWKHQLLSDLMSTHHLLAVLQVSLCGSSDLEFWEGGDDITVMSGSAWEYVWGVRRLRERAMERARVGAAGACECASSLYSCGTAQHAHCTVHVLSLRAHVTSSFGPHPPFL